MRLDRSERGSLPVVMLAILVVGTLVTLLVGTVVVGEGQTRFDQGFEQSLPVAETGLERMLYLVRSGQRTDDFSLAEAQDAGGRYSGAAARVGRMWTLTATGIAANGTSRTVTVTVNIESAVRSGRLRAPGVGATRQQQRRLLPVGHVRPVAGVHRARRGIERLQRPDVHADGARRRSRRTGSSTSTASSSTASTGPRSTTRARASPTRCRAQPGSAVASPRPAPVPSWPTSASPSSSTPIR